MLSEAGVHLEYKYNELQKYQTEQTEPER